MIKITIPFKTPSVNCLYFNWNGRKIKTKQAKDLDKEIKIIVQNGLYEQLEGELKLSMIVYEDWYTKKNTIKKKDLDNKIKFLQDSVLTALRIEDSQVFELNVKKVHSTQNKTEIELWTLN